MERILCKNSSPNLKCEKCNNNFERGTALVVDKDKREFREFLCNKCSKILINNTKKDDYSWEN